MCSKAVPYFIARTAESIRLMFGPSGSAADALARATELQTLGGRMSTAMAVAVAAHQAIKRQPHAGQLSSTISSTAAPELRLTLLATWNDSDELDLYCHSAPMPPPRRCADHFGHRSAPRDVEGRGVKQWASEQRGSGTRCVVVPRAQAGGRRQEDTIAPERVGMIGPVTTSRSAMGPSAMD